MCWNSVVGFGHICSGSRTLAHQPFGQDHPFQHKILALLIVNCPNWGVYLIPPSTWYWLTLKKILLEMVLLNDIFHCDEFELGRPRHLWVKPRNMYCTSNYVFANTQTQLTVRAQIVIEMAPESRPNCDISLLGQFGLHLACRYNFSCNSKY